VNIISFTEDPWQVLATNWLYNNRNMSVIPKVYKYACDKKRASNSKLP